MSIFDDLSEPLAQRLAEGLARLAAVARENDWRVADAAGATPTQAEILHLLVMRPEGLRLAAVARHLGVRSATASEAVTALERKAMLEKLADPSDGRAVLLRATPAGRALAAAWPESHAAAVAGLTRSEQETLLRLVSKMIRHLQSTGQIAPQRNCVSCRHFCENVARGAELPHFCAFAGAPMGDRHLRIECPEHEALAA